MMTTLHPIQLRGEKPKNVIMKFPSKISLRKNISLNSEDQKSSHKNKSNKISRYEAFTPLQHSNEELQGKKSPFRQTINSVGRGTEQKLSLSKVISKATPPETLNQSLTPAKSPKNAEKKVCQIKYKQKNKHKKIASLNIQNLEKPSRKLFQRYYLPRSEVIQAAYLYTLNPDDKYVYQNGNSLECKRIHNFYTSSMFRKGYGRCFQSSYNWNFSKK